MYKPQGKSMAKCVQCAKNLLPNRQKQTENTTKNTNVVLCSYCGCAQDLPSVDLADEKHGENSENREDGLEQNVLEALFEQDEKDKTSAISRIHVVAFWVLWLGVGVIALLVWNHA